MDISEIIKRLVPITQFNQGKSSQLFARVKNGEPLVVMKNNQAKVVVVSVEEYMALIDLKNACLNAIDNDNIREVVEMVLKLQDLEGK